MSKEDQRLSSPSNVKKLLAQLGHKPKKGLGQNYLIDANILEIIAEAAEISRKDSILEIGPGLGILTEILLKKGAFVTAIEKDRKMASHLRSWFADLESRLDIIQDDALRIDLGELFRERSNKVVSNLPYSTGTRMLVEMIEAENKPETIVVMLQQEVGQRISAIPSTKPYSRLAIWCQMFYEVELYKKVSPNCFLPRPRVWSAVIRMRLRETPKADLHDYSLFKGLTSYCFSQRRKQIGSLLRKKETLQGRHLKDPLPILEECGIDPRARPETIPVALWGKLSNLLFLPSDE